MNAQQIEGKKQIKKEIRKRISMGEPKQQVLEDMSKNYKDKITIVKFLEITPSLAMKRKYLYYRYLLLFMIIAALILDTILAFRVNSIHWLDYLSYLNLVLDIVLLTALLLNRVEAYSWIAARAVVSILQIIISNAYYHYPIDAFTLASLILVVFSFFLGLFLSVKLCPPRIPKTIEVDIDGIEKINKTVYVFPD